eukprot:6245692-Alexandrium_andersonii.AAC.1
MPSHTLSDVVRRFWALVGAFQRVQFAEKRLKLPGAAPWWLKAFWWSAVGGLAPPDCPLRGCPSRTGLGSRALAPQNRNCAEAPSGHLQHLRPGCRAIRYISFRGRRAA